MSQRSINVKVAPELKFGEFANAFRVVEEVGPDCFLDFMVYSSLEDEATVVARIRVRRDFLDQIRDQLKEALIVFEDGAPSAASQTLRKGESVH